MSNSYYNHTTYPTPNSPGSSSTLRLELDAITTGFSLLPTLAANGYKVAMVNSAGTALIASSALQSLAITLSTLNSTPIGASSASTGAFTTVSATTFTGALTGNASTATALLTARTIGGTSFDGTANVTSFPVPGAIGGTTPSTGAFTTVSATTFTGALTGNASTATALATSRTIGGTSFDGTANVTSFPVPGAIGGTTPSTGAFTTVSATTFTGALTGNASTATALATARTIGGTSFDGTANVTSFPVPGAIGGTTPSTGAFTSISASTTLGVTGVATFTAQPIVSSLTASKPVFTDASSGLTSSGTLAYDQGGTGQTSYAAGDIVYASGINTLAKLAIGTSGQRLVVAAGVPSWATDTTVGTVTSVSWTGGIVSVATATTTPAFTIAGTSGGVPYFSSGTTWATSAALAASALVIGGGAGAAPSTTTTGTGVVTALGVNTGSAGAFVVNGGALGSPSSVGTMPAFTLGGTVSGGGNQINNVVIGTTTPLAGNFTTLTTSSTVTHNGGTANGVAYLDGSKVLTTGSALTFNGTSLGVGSSDYGNAGSINLSVGVVGTTTGGVQLWSNTTSTHSIQWGDGTTGSDTYRGAIEYAHNGDSMRFYTSATEQMRLTSTGLGIGTSSPTVKLDVVGAISATGTLSGGTSGTAYSFSGSAPATSLTLDSSGNVGIGTSSPAYKLDVSTGSGQGIRLKTTGAYSTILTDNTGTTGGGSYAAYQNGVQITIFGVEGAILGNTSTNTAIYNDVVGGGIKLYTNASATPKATLDSAGNLGLGVTPSAWESTQGSRAIQFTGSAVYGYRDTNLILTQNAYFDGGFKYYASSIAAGYYGIGSGVHSWYNAASGTAGNAITFTQAMTLDASGNLGIGTTSFSARFTANSDNSTAYANTAPNIANCTAAFTNASGHTAGGTFVGYQLNISGNSQNRIGYIGAVSESTSNQGLSLVFGTNTTAGDRSEKMRLDSAGNLGLGVTPSAWGGDFRALQGEFGQSWFYSNTATNTGLVSNAHYNGTNWIYKTGNAAVLYDLGQGTSGGGHRWQVADAGTQGDPITFTQAMTLLGNGNLLLGTTSTVGSSKQTIGYNGNLNNGLTLNETQNVSNTAFIYFYDGNASAVIGSVTRVGTTAAVIFNTTSDYRLKTVVGAVSGQGARIDALKPIDYLWKEGSVPARGFLAHEFQEVYANSVKGTKDAIDADGKPMYQAMQAATSEVIADLVAELQSLRARVAQLESKP